MQAGIVFTSYVPTALVGVNSPSPTLAAEVVTGMQIASGAFPGNVFHLSEDFANQLSASAVNGSAIQQCHRGWYMVAQIDSGATVANLKAGYVVAQKAYSQGPYVLTSVDQEIALGAAPAVLLGNPTGGFTPGYYTIVQVSGDANLFLKAGTVASEGTVAVYASADNGQGSIPTQSTQVTYALYAGILGQLQQQSAQSALNRVVLNPPFGVI